MELQELTELLEHEKQRLLKATNFIESFYKQIFHSLVNLRDTLFNHVFPPDLDWKNQLSGKVASLEFPVFDLSGSETRMQNISEFCLRVLNNLQSLWNAYLPQLESISVEGVARIQEVNNYTKTYMKHLFMKENLAILSGQRLEAAKSVQHSILERLETNISPFLRYLEQIVQDEYKAALRPELEKLVGNFRQYMSDPAGYDNQLRQTCQEHQLEYHQELILGIIADLSQDRRQYLEALAVKYRNSEVADQKKNIFRLREIAGRFIAQAANISRLEGFLLAVHAVFQPVSLWTRFLRFLLKLFTGRGGKGPQKDFTITYSSRQGRLEPRHVTLLGLIKSLDLFKSFLAKFRMTADLSSYSKANSQEAASRLENMIDNCITDLTKIYDQCIGLREWLVNPRNRKMLKKLPQARQEEFNDLLLSLNYTLIVSKQYLRDMGKVAGNSSG